MQHDHYWRSIWYGWCCNLTTLDGAKLGNVLDLTSLQQWLVGCLFPAGWEVEKWNVLVSNFKDFLSQILNNICLKCWRIFFSNSKNICLKLTCLRPKLLVKCIWLHCSSGLLVACSLLAGEVETEPWTQLNTIARCIIAHWINAHWTQLYLG